MIHAGTFALPGAAWRWAMARIDTLGQEVTTEDGQRTKEIQNLILSVEAPLQGWPIAGSGWDLPALQVYVRDQIIGDENRTGFSYTYGQRIKPHVHDVIEHLRHEPTTRRAVISIWDGFDYGQVHPPCWMTLDFLRRNEQLHLTALIRSNDIKQAWPANVFGLGVLMDQVATELGVEVGCLTTHSVSAHIYLDGVA